MRRRRPSIFSSNYREQLRWQRINIALITLILVLAAFFGGRYYINKNNIKLFENSRIANLFQYVKDKVTPQKGIGKEKTNPAPGNEASSVKPQPQTTVTPPATQENKEGKYDYTLSDGKVVSVGYTILDDKKEIKEFKDGGSGAFYDISSDKQKIVFEDKSSQDIITCDVNGSFAKLTLKEYVSKTSGEVVEKEYNQKRRPWYVWSQKPHFTMDGRVAYLSNLPYLQPDQGLYLWTVNLDGTGNRKVGKLSNNMASISYAGYTEDGKLIIKDGDTLYYLEQGSYALKR